LRAIFQGFFPQYVSASDLFDIYEFVTEIDKFVNRLTVLRKNRDGLLAEKG